MLQYILKEPHMCIHICVGREICYSKVIARKSKLKIFMPYLRVTREKDLIQKDPPNPQVEREYYQYLG